MKYFNIFCLISTFSYAQLPPEVVDNVWYLQGFEAVSGGWFDFSNHPEFENVTLAFSVEDGVTHYQTQVCATRSGMVENAEENWSEDPMIIFTNNVTNCEFCIDDAANDFENEYFNHIFGETYWFSVIENSDGSLTLTLESPNFCYASFSNQSMATNDISNQKIKIYPNPVVETLFIENSKFEKSEFQMFDSQGKSVLIGELKSELEELNLSQFAKGVYFIQIKSKEKLILNEKILKR